MHVFAAKVVKERSKSIGGRDIDGLPLIQTFFTPWVYDLPELHL